MDAAVRQEAHGRISDLFRNMGQARQQESTTGLQLGGLAEQVEEFMTMPLDLAIVFLDLSTELAELVLRSLEEAGIVLIKGMTPA